MPNDLNVKTSQRISVLLTLMILGLFLGLAWSRTSIVAVPGVYVIALLWIDSARPKGGGLACAASLAALLACGALMVTHSFGLFVLGLVGLATTWLMNADFYRLLARCEGRAFAIGAFPLHLLHFLICGSAYAIAVCENLAKACLRFRRFRAEPQVLALTEQELT